eukprot:gnl/MRDRNA2_/MRDRNA2_23469_c0_seq2.p1 gnl/MRDRNA2_/MRDRNA2_23469_c0~~gnl/MRDRNA2_/MRDRNA2_23469_c0_seq2.p1  ORF type:complete len:297 (+),score=40.39 gnl/MRDRNA2_/MRDRNA2_23469_c0_seq2:354-1244(+)
MVSFCSGDASRSRNLGNVLFACQIGSLVAVSTQWHTLQVRGQDVHVYSPALSMPQKRLPVVIALHGTDDTALNFQRVTRFADLARQSQDFLAVFPEMPPWKHGAWGFMDASDLLQFESIVDALSKSYFVRRDAVFLVGHSEGGTISLILGNNAPNVFRAVAAVESGVPGNLTLYHFNSSNYGSPLMLVWNMNDPVLNAYKVPGCSHCTLYQHTLQVLRRHAPTEKPQLLKPVHFTGHNLSYAEQISWPSFDNQAEMRMIKWASRIPTHRWPNKKQVPGCFDSATLVWDFFQDVMQT